MEILKVCLDYYFHFGTTIEFTDNKPTVLPADIRQEFRNWPRTLHGCQNMFDHSLISAFSKSRDMGDILRLLPGIVVQKTSLTMQGMAELYGVKAELLERLSNWIIEPFSRLRSLTCTPTCCKNTCLASCRIELWSYAASCFYLSSDSVFTGWIQCLWSSLVGYVTYVIIRFEWTFSNPFKVIFELSDYVLYYFYHHLCAATEKIRSGRDILADHPAVEILNDLTYYHPNQRSHHLTRYTIQAVLRWAADTLNGLKLLHILRSHFSNTTS